MVGKVIPVKPKGWSTSSKLIGIPTDMEELPTYPEKMLGLLDLKYKLKIKNTCQMKASNITI